MAIRVPSMANFLKKWPPPAFTIPFIFGEIVIIVKHPALLVQCILDDIGGDGSGAVEPSLILIAMACTQQRVSNFQATTPTDTEVGIPRLGGRRRNGRMEILRLFTVTIIHEGVTDRNDRIIESAKIIDLVVHDAVSGTSYFVRALKAMLMRASKQKKWRNNIPMIKIDIAFWPGDEVRTGHRAVGDWPIAESQRECQAMVRIRIAYP